MVYQWKQNAPLSMPVDAQLAGETLEALENLHGEITPKIVLNASRDTDAPLHHCFEWNDGIAAEKYREVQAGHIIRSITVTIDQPNTEPQVVRAFVNVAPPSAKVGSFKSTVVALQNHDMRQQVLLSALAELRAFQRKFAGFKELANVFDSIDLFANSSNFNHTNL